jgi:hypothetical protein
LQKELIMHSFQRSAKLGSPARRVFCASALAVLGSVGGLTLALAIEACGSDSGTTSGHRIALETRIELMGDATSFRTAAGWDVTLTKAMLSTGPLYYFDGAPPLVQLRARSLRQFALGAFGVATAHAHPGHYQQGNALGQMLESWSVDLLAGPTDLPVGDGVTGTYRSARFSFIEPPVGPMASELADHAAIVEGRAERAGEDARRFVATATLAEIEHSAAEGHVDGCEFTELDIDRYGRVTVTVNPKVWLDLVDFSELQPAVGDAPSEFPADSQPRIAFAQGLAQLSAYKFSYSSP